MCADVRYVCFADFALVLEISILMIVHVMIVGLDFIFRKKIIRILLAFGFILESKPFFRVL